MMDDEIDRIVEGMGVEVVCSDWMDGKVGLTGRLDESK